MSKPIKLGVGLLPREQDPRPVHLGHMWPKWTQTEEDYHHPYRGFYPDIELDPDKYKSSSQARREIVPLLKRGVPGKIEADQRAIVWSTEIPEQIISVE